MLIALTRPSGTTVWIASEKITMVEPSKAQGVGAIIHTTDKRTIEVRDQVLDIVKLINGD